MKNSFSKNDFPSNRFMFLCKWGNELLISFLILRFSAVRLATASRLYLKSSWGDLNSVKTFKSHSQKSETFAFDKSAKWVQKNGSKNGKKTF